MSPCKGQTNVVNENNGQRSLAIAPYSKVALSNWSTLWISIRPAPLCRQSRRDSVSSNRTHVRPRSGDLGYNAR
jgi:hypothetical protein